MAVRAVIFDFGGVLCFHPPADRFVRIAAVLGLDPHTLERGFWLHRVAYDAGKIEPAEFWSLVAKETGGTFSESLLPRLVRLEVEAWNNYDQRMLDWAAHLRTQGYRTAVLSNLPRVLGEGLRATPGFLDPFDHVTFSFELGMVKPEAGIYRHSIAGLDIAPGEALFLDDRIENIRGAVAQGLNAELFSTLEQFAAEAAPRYALPMLDPIPSVARRQ